VQTRKKMKKILYTILLAAFTHSASAQNVDFKAANFKDDKDGLKKAIENIKKGDGFRDAGNDAVLATKDPGLNFELAIKHYLLANKFNPKNAELNFKLANCYAWTNEKYETKKYADKATKLNPEVNDLLYFYMGRAFQYDKQFAKALKQYKKFEVEAKSKLALEMKKFLSKYKQECKHGKALVGAPVRAWVDNVEVINTKYNDFSPCISTDGATMYFTSNRENGKTANDVGTYDTDIYVSEMTKGKWGKPKNAGTPLSTTADEVVTNMGYDGTKMLLFRKEMGKEVESYDVMETFLKGASWTSPVSMSRNINTRANQTFASYNYNDVKIFYLSDLGSNSSGMEIYFSGVMDRKKRQYGNGQTLGRVINTKFNEGSVFMHPDGETMYFSSEGHNSMGGMDIFVSTKKQGQWTEPKNLGYPINTPYDDVFFASTASGKWAYISSNRPGGKGAMDMYKVTFWGSPKEPLVDTEDYLLASIAKPIKDPQIEAAVDVNKVSLTVFKGKTIDHLTKKPVEAAFDITDNGSGSVMSSAKSNSATGKFLLSLQSGKNYGIAVKADGYLFHSENFDIPNGSEYNMVDKVIELKNIKVGSKIALRNVFFETAKSIIKPDSDAELMRLVGLLKEVPALKIELSGHTDNTGSKSFNDKLSQDRADAVVNWLVKKGIDKSRLTSKGYGSARPVATNKSSEGRQQNRRTEFEITAN
jgi:outer membrane protein OmpA-like peptidoglycan-associated protein